MFFLFVLVFLAVVSITIVGFSLYYGISPMPTSKKAKHAIFSCLPTKHKKKIYELGSGWGTLAFPLARSLKKSQIYAYEISPIPWIYSKFLQLFERFPNLSIFRKNFFTVSLKDADGVVCYLYPKAMQRLKEKFEKELQAGAFVITNSFAIPGWIPDKVVEVDDFFKSTIYLYNR